MKEFQEANYARVRRRGPRRSSSDIARAKIQGKCHRVSCLLQSQMPLKWVFFLSLEGNSFAQVRGREMRTLVSH